MPLFLPGSREFVPESALSQAPWGGGGWPPGMQQHDAGAVVKQLFNRI